MGLGAISRCQRLQIPLHIPCNALNTQHHNWKYSCYKEKIIVGKRGALMQRKLCSPNDQCQRHTFRGAFDHELPGHGPEEVVCKCKEKIIVLLLNHNHTRITKKAV